MLIGICRQVFNCVKRLKNRNKCCSCRQALATKEPKKSEDKADSSEEEEEKKEKLSVIAEEDEDEEEHEEESQKSRHGSANEVKGRVMILGSVLSTISSSSEENEDEEPLSRIQPESGNKNNELLPIEDQILLSME